MTQDEPEPKPKRRTWLIVLLAVGIPLLCVVLCCGGLGIFGWNMGKDLFKDLYAAVPSAQAFLEGLAAKGNDGNQPNAQPAEAKGAPNDPVAKRVEAIYQTTSSGFKAAVSLQQFRDLVAKYPVLTDGGTISFSGMRIVEQPGGKRAVINVSVANANNSIACTVTLVKENEVWKVDGFTVP
jgi:hypothetical protein